MAGPAPESGDDAGLERGDGTPRWVKVSAIVGIAVLVLVAVVLLLGGPGGHGPGRHLPAGQTPEVGGSPDHTAPPGAPDHG